MALLYRGVSKSIDKANSARLLPKGKNKEIVARADGRIQADGRFNAGPSEKNAVEAHHIETALYDGCFISATRDENRARYFATNKYTESGWVYVIDESLLSKYNVVKGELKDPLYPDEREVSLRAHDNGILPKAICIDKYEVNFRGETL